MTSSTRRPEGLRLAVFAKAPVAGEVKTRLAPLLGDDGAARLHAALTRRAIASAVRARLGPVELWCMPDVKHAFFTRCRDEFGVTLHRQRGADLGERMANAFARAHAQGDAMLLVGSDCPALTPARLRSVARALEGRHAVLTPAEDGGYVLVALKRPAPIFEAMPWGEATVMEQTRERLGRARLRWKEMPTLWDVDRPEDYVRLQGMDLGREARA
jgi:rSAM/selenodomain-associated transferase 1